MERFAAHAADLLTHGIGDLETIDPIREYGNPYLAIVWVIVDVRALEYHPSVPSLFAQESQPSDYIC